MTDNELIALLLDAGFNNGWAFSGTQLILWEHDAEPPAPFTRPVVEKSAKTAK
jgi:hypothetical protein